MDITSYINNNSKFVVDKIKHIVKKYKDDTEECALQLKLQSEHYDDVFSTTASYMLISQLSKNAEPSFSSYINNNHIFPSWLKSFVNMHKLRLDAMVVTCSVDDYENDYFDIKRFHHMFCEYTNARIQYIIMLRAIETVLVNKLSKITSKTNLEQSIEEHLNRHKWCYILDLTDVCTMFVMYQFDLHFWCDPRYNLNCLLKNYMEKNKSSSCDLKLLKQRTNKKNLIKLMF